MVFKSTWDLPESDVDLLGYCVYGSKADDQRKMFVDAENLDDYITLGHFKSLIRQMAAGLHALGVQKGQCVTLLSDNDIRQPVLWFGCMAVGAIYSPIATNFKHAEIERALKESSAQYAVVRLKYLDEFIKAAPFDWSKIILFEPTIYTIEIETKHGRFFNWPWLLTHGEREPIRITDVEALKTTPHARQFTSGTTGTAKAAEIAHSSTLEVLRAKEYADRAKDYEIRLLHYLDMYHISQQFQTTYSLRMGASMYIMNENPSKVAAYIHSLQITEFLLPPGCAADILETTPLPDLEYKLRSVRDISFGGAMSQDDIYAKFKGWIHPQGRARASYGSTEGGILTSTDYDAPEQDLAHGSISKLSAGVSFKLTDPNDYSCEITSYDTTGLIWCKAPSRFIGYHNNPTATSEMADSEGFLNLGDLGYISSKNNEWYLVGRSKDVFKVDCSHVAPVEVEQCITAVTGVRDAAIVPVKVDGEVWPRIGAFVVRDRKMSDEDGERLKQDVIARVSEDLCDYKAITGNVEFLDELPRNSLGKLVRCKLPDMQVV